MNQPIYTTSYMGVKTMVFPSYISQKALIGPEKTIVIKQITSIETGTRFTGKVEIKTSDGKKHILVMRIADKEAFRDAVYSTMNS